MSIRWFGGPGQSPGICEVPLETFVSAIDLLESTGVRRICLLGSSKGAEAALLTSIRDPRVDGVVAMSPTSVVWGNVGPGRDGQHRPYRSSWTWKGQPLPFVPYDDWTAPEPANGPVAIRGWYERSERTFADLLPAAEIPIEETEADVPLVAGGDDAMWPSLPYAERLIARRRTACLVSRAEAGHRPRLLGEGVAPESPRSLHGVTLPPMPSLGRPLGRTSSICFGADSAVRYAFNDLEVSGKSVPQLGTHVGALRRARVCRTVPTNRSGGHPLLKSSAVIPSACPSGHWTSSIR